MIKRAVTRRASTSWRSGSPAPRSSRSTRSFAFAADAVRAGVEVVRLQNPDATPNDVARIIVYQRSKLSAIAGAVSALPGAFPGVGTATEIGASLADVALLVYAQVALVMAVAAAYDHDLDAYDDRAADVRVVWRWIPASHASASTAPSCLMARHSTRAIGCSTRISTASSARSSSSAPLASARARCSGARSRSASASRSVRA